MLSDNINGHLFLACLFFLKVQTISQNKASSRQEMAKILLGLGEKAAGSRSDIVEQSISIYNVKQKHSLLLFRVTYKQVDWEFLITEKWLNEEHNSFSNSLSGYKAKSQLLV